MAKEKRLIYLEDALRVMPALEMCTRALLKLPTVDAVEVVRCKDCKHWTMGYCNHFAYYGYEPMTSEDDFCSYGERKDNGKE